MAQTSSSSTRIPRCRSTDGPKTLPSRPEPEVAGALQKALDGYFPEARADVRVLLEDPSLRPTSGLTVEEARQHTTEALSKVLKTGMPYGAFRTDQGGTGDTGGTLSGIEMLGHTDLSLMVKSGVQWGLFGGAVSNLGTERHGELVRDLIELRALGCFAMTERGHGSDVQSLETTAHYDPETEEFILNSPTASSEKWFLGNAARDGRWAAVFCQLYTPGQEESHGVHCIVARIRNDDGSPVDGVAIGDHGTKGGLLGVDNGTLMFDHYRVPRENLLNRFADVSATGEYSSDIDSPNARFFTMLGALVRGRVTVGAAAGAATRTALTIGTKYAHLRRQFAPDDSLPEKKLIEHRQHRIRLLPRIARSYGLQFATNLLIKRIHDLEAEGLDRANLTPEQARDLREVEAHAAALKVANTAHATDAIQEMREATGGAGYMAENLLTILKEDSDVFTTFEGDNVVMLQLVTKELLGGFAREVQSFSNLEMVRFGLDNFSGILRRRTGADAVVQNLLDALTDADESSLFDPASQMQLLIERENRLLKSLARRLRPARKLPVEKAARLVDKVQDHMISCAWAHIDRMILEAFFEAESTITDERSQEVLEQVRDVFFLSVVCDNAGWFLEQSLLTGTRTKGARAGLADLVDSLGPWSEVLVDAFGVPSTMLDIPMMEPYEAMTPKAKANPAI
ncbi:acyl-CoA dehydrogenase family protein [Corynebacterium sp. MSK151]|uniref:acyl-CoA dehydrogenase family protein n=1 Tax=unclassified Corynebacterium TaxID=2624378 RepID=UPI00254FA732|nr:MULTISPECIES: acyl-CoA dehydrogenase family protein [unclassified Corynebacterium]MDK8758208.1 acyl-CoA dehydrogenase family protein [Corynebacterium sp. MSK151]MDK8847229.1 acyl-CoA dehydrogenase family protein [Corynebacterium sp. MSK047]